MLTINKFDQITVGATLDDSNISAPNLIPTTTDDTYLTIDKIMLSVYKAAVEEDGLLQILDSNGDPIWTVNVSSIKEPEFKFGDRGLTVGKNVGAQALLSGASTQASVSLAAVYHIAIDNV